AHTIVDRLRTLLLFIPPPPPSPLFPYTTLFRSTRAANSRPTGSNSRPFGRPHRRPNVGTVGASREAHKASGRSAPQGGAFMLSIDRKSTRLNSSHVSISYAVFCLKKKNKNNEAH